MNSKKMPENLVSLLQKRKKAFESLGQKDAEKIVGGTLSGGVVIGGGGTGVVDVGKGVVARW